jgi:ferritin-like protein
MADSGYHEPYEQLTQHTQDLHRALRSLQEELEAIDWYRQRADVTEDAALREVLVHNLEEEEEHACMVLEWLRRQEPVWDRQLRTYLFSELPITAVEEVAERGDVAAATGDAVGERDLGRTPERTPEQLTVGSLKGGRK